MANMIRPFTNHRANRADESGSKLIPAMIQYQLQRRANTSYGTSRILNRKAKNPRIFDHGQSVCNDLNSEHLIFRKDGSKEGTQNMATHSAAVMSAAAAAALNQTYNSSRFMSTRSSVYEQRIPVFARRRVTRSKSVSAAASGKKNWKKLNRCVHTVFAFSKGKKFQSGSEVDDNRRPNEKVCKYFTIPF